MFHDSYQQLHILQLNDLYKMSIVTVYHTTIRKRTGMWAGHRVHICTDWGESCCPCVPGSYAYVCQLFVLYLVYIVFDISKVVVFVFIIILKYLTPCLF